MQSPTCVALLPGGLRAYVTRPSKGDVVEVDADPQSGTFGQALAFIPLPGAPEGIAVAPSGQRAYVTDQTAGVVEELDVDVTSALYRHVLREIPVPNAILAGGIAIDPRRERLVLTTKNLGMVSVDLDSTEIVTTLSSQVGGAGVAVTPGGNRVLAVAPAPDAGTILFADPLGQSGSVVVGGDARDIKVTNSTLWADIAHAMFVGIHGNSISPETAAMPAVTAAVRQNDTCCLYMTCPSSMLTSLRMPATTVRSAA